MPTTLRLNPRRIVNGAIASGRIPESRREFWEGRLTTAAGPAARGTALFDLISLHPVLAASPARTSDAASPLLPAYRQSHPHLVTAAQAERPAPTLFATGAAPAATASGIDPALVARLPWIARRPVAAEPDRAKAAAMLDTYGGPDGDLFASLDLSAHPSNRDYRDAMTAWLTGTPTASLPEHKPSGGHASASAQLDDPELERLYRQLFGG